MTSQRDLFTKRWRRAAPPDPSELAIQIALADRLRLQAHRDVIWFHCPNGELRDARTAAKLRAMGTLAGVPDLTFIQRITVLDGEVIVPRILFLELKARGRKPTADQIAFAKRAEACGCTWKCADTVDEAVTILETYGILPSGRKSPR
jgi:hypothetical protein